MKFSKFLIFLGFLGGIDADHHDENPSTGTDLNQLANLLTGIMDEYEKTAGQNQDYVRKVCTLEK